MRTIGRLCALRLVSGLTVLGVSVGASSAAAKPLKRVHFHDVTSDYCTDIHEFIG